MAGTYETYIPPLLSHVSAEGPLGAIDSDLKLLVQLMFQEHTTITSEYLT